MLLVFATQNLHKVKEVASLLPSCYTIAPPSEFGWQGEIPEEQDTLEGNSLQKAQVLYDALQRPLFSDDSGLEVEALGGAPGVYSARYAGEHCSFDDNINKLLKALEGTHERSARFRTVVTLIIEGEVHQFQGCVEGEILTERHGAEGFGYDPIFRPEGTKLSFAEMPLAQKNGMSHRARAVAAMVDYLRKAFPCA